MTDSNLPEYWMDRLRNVQVERDCLREQLADALKEIAKLNAGRTFCPDCGGTYMATGIEAGCPCKLKAEIERERDSANKHFVRVGELTTDNMQLQARIAELEAENARLREGEHA